MRRGLEEDPRLAVGLESRKSGGDVHGVGVEDVASEGEILELMREGTRGDDVELVNGDTGERY